MLCCHWQEDLGAYIANGLHCKGVHVAVGDFVVTKTKVVLEVRVCGLSDSNLFLLGDACEVTHSRETSIEVARTESLRLIWITDNTDVGTVNAGRHVVGPIVFVSLPILCLFEKMTSTMGIAACMHACELIVGSLAERRAFVL